MKTYQVGLVYEFQADDEEHAIEQFIDTILDAYYTPDDPQLAAIVWPNVLTEVDDE